ncbi:MAG TPA: glycosyl transferase family 2, partial [Actinobacteria bacterium]|nr:glycosyl transferase family 2 [Actinomycetota bacterium]
MAETMSILRKDVLEQAKVIGRADIVIGIPSFQNAKTVAGVVKAAGEGATAHFPSLKVVLVDSDGRSTDGTRDIIRRAILPEGVEKIVTLYRGLSGKGSALRTIFEIADILDARACILLDADSYSITPDWVHLLGEPILSGAYGFVAPHYLRDKHDATITNNLVYPLNRALYGAGVRQPIGGDFGLSGGLVKTLVHRRVWESETDVNRFGVDIWMTTIAINEGFRVCQASLGAKVHDAKDPAIHLGPMFKQVVGTMLSLMRQYEGRWKAAWGSGAVEILGGFHYVEVERTKISLPELAKRFRNGLKEYKEFWQLTIPENNYSRVMKLAHVDMERFHFPIDLWAKLVYDFAVAYNFGEADREKVLDALLPLFFGRALSFA